MQQTRAVEIGTGLFVFLGFAALLFLSTQTTNLEAYMGANTYAVTAHFTNVGGLKPRSPVSMAGVTIGRVEKIEFDPERLNAVVTMKINSKYNQIPEDSDAGILTAGLLGGQYVGLTPGGSDEYLENGDELYLTQSAVVLENLLSKYLFSQGGAGAGTAEAPPAPQAAPERNEMQAPQAPPDEAEEAGETPQEESAEQAEEAEETPQEGSADAAGEAQPLETLDASPPDDAPAEEAPEPQGMEESQ